MISLIDGDIVTYRCAASCQEGDGVDVAILRADKLMGQILEETQADEYKVFISGGSNFRYDVWSEYKANRRDVPKPPHLQPTREFLVTEWNAEPCDGMEADDALGIAQRKLDTVICSIDKDLLQVPGNHYNFVKQEWKEINERCGFINFYRQLILGDKGDNIPGFDGLFRSKTPKFIQRFYDELESLETEREMYDHCLSLYNGDEETLQRNAQLLYILREEGKYWTKPQNMSEKL